MFKRSATTTDTLLPLLPRRMLRAHVPTNSGPPLKAIATPPRGGKRLSKIPLPWRRRWTARKRNQARRGQSSASMAWLVAKAFWSVGRLSVRISMYESASVVAIQSLQMCFWAETSNRCKAKKWTSGKSNSSFHREQLHHERP